MPNKGQKNKPTPGDLIGNKAAHLGVSLSNGPAECLCHVYALVLKDIGSMLGAVDDQDNEAASNEPENEETIKSMITALEEIHRKLSHFKVNSKINESCPEYSTFIYSDINDLIPELVFITSRLKNMARIYNIAKLEPLEHPEQLSIILDTSERYETYLLECRTHIIAINTHIKWWCEDLSPQGCQGQRAAG